jgi:sugar phosphate isomerase/epimerase
VSHHDKAVGPRIRASHHSLSGSQHGQPPAHSLLARVDAAHSAGISEIGACAADLGSWNAAELTRLVRHRHVKVTEVEWIDLGEIDYDAEDAIFALASMFSSHQVNVGVCSPTMYPDGWLANRLSHVANRAQKHGLIVAFEPVVFGSVNTIGRVQSIIALAQHPPNVGTLLDVYHLARSCWDNLNDVRPDLVAGVQINGIDRPAIIPSWPHGLLREAQCDRLLPDEGTFPVATWLQRLRDAGVNARLSVEVLSDAHRALPLDEQAVRLASSAAKFAEIWDAVR